MNRRTLTVGMAGGARATAGGMLATALAVYVGRDGSAFLVGMLSTALFAATMVCTPLWGALGDLTARYRRLLVRISVATVALPVGFVFTRGPWDVIGLRGLYAAFAVGFAPLLLSVVRAGVAPERRGKASGFLSSAMAGGDVVAQASVGALLVVLAPAELFGLVAAVGAVGLAAVSRLDADRAPAADPSPTDGGRDSPGVGLGTLVRGVYGRLVPTADERRLLRRTGLDWLFAALALRHAAVRGIGSLVPLFLLTQLGTGEALMGLLLTVSPAGQVVFMRVSGDFSDAPGRVKPLLVVGMVTSAVYGPGLAAAAILPGPARYGAAVVAFLAVAAGFSALDMGAVALIGGSVSPARETTFLGFRATAGGVGGVVGPTLVGALVAAFGYGVAFVVAGALAGLAAVVVALALPEARPAIGDRPPVTRRVETSIGTHHPTPGNPMDDD